MSSRTIYFIMMILLIIHTFHPEVDGNEGGIDDPTSSQHISTTSRSLQTYDDIKDQISEQFRSIWLEGYQIINQSEVERVIELATTYNINCVSPLINGNYYGVYYNSSYISKYPEVHWSFDPLMSLIREAHKYNIKVVPWFHTMIDYFALRNNPDWGVVSNGGSTSSAWMNPARPEVRSYLCNITRELFTNYPLDGIKLDTIRYPSSAYSYDQYSIEKYTLEGWDDFDAFRRQQITEVVQSIYSTVMEIRPYSLIGADISSSEYGRMDHWFQDVQTWREKKVIDFVTPMIYTTSKTYYASQIQDNIDRFDFPVIGGTYVFVPGNTAHGSVPDQETGIDILLNQTDEAISRGAAGTCMFAYKFLSEWPDYGAALRDGIFSMNMECISKNQTIPVGSTRWEFDREQDREGWKLYNTGHNYPDNGFWSITHVKEPLLLSPMVQCSATGMNVIEISMIAESTLGEFHIFWRNCSESFKEFKQISVDMKTDGGWNLYSIHLDKSYFWKKEINYLMIELDFPSSTNLTLDFIRLLWMPYCIRECAYLGPFITGESEDLLDREFINLSEPRYLPLIGDVTSGREWRPFGMERDLLDLRFIFNELHFTSVYINIYVMSNISGTVQLRIGTTDAVKVWLNSNLVLCSRKSRDISPDQNITSVWVEKGINRLLMRLTTLEHDGAFYIRFTDKDNRSISALSYRNDLMIADPPEIINELDGWIGVNSTRMSWSGSVSTARVIGYEYHVDEGDKKITSEPWVDLRDLSDGYHTFHVRSFDDLGFYSDMTVETFKVDTKRPIISVPVPERDFTVDGSITWTWVVVSEPISGISHYELNVTRWFKGEDLIKKPFMDALVYDTLFSIDDIGFEGYHYDLSVKAVSKNGLKYETRSAISVIYDNTPPLEIFDSEISVISENTRTYKLQWSGSFDNVYNGVRGYEIWCREDMKEWYLFNFTTETDFLFVRDIGKNLSFRIRSVDLAGHQSSFSETIRLPNKAPIATFEVPKLIKLGEPTCLSANRSYDPDGVIIGYNWYLDGALISERESAYITLLPCVHHITLHVIDDIGCESTTGVLFRIGNYSDYQYTRGLFHMIVENSTLISYKPPLNNTIIQNISINDDLNRTILKEEIIKLICCVA